MWAVLATIWVLNPAHTLVSDEASRPSAGAAGAGAAERSGSAYVHAARARVRLADGRLMRLRKRYRVCAGSLARRR